MAALSAAAGAKAVGASWTVGSVLELTDNKGRKVIVETTVYAAGVATARGEVVAVQMPKTFVGG